MTCRTLSRSTPKAVLVLSLLVLVLGAAGRAAADESAASEALAPGSWSVQFSVQPNFTLGSYSGSTLSLKRHLGSGNALRFGVSLSGSNRSDDGSGSSGDTSFVQLRSTGLDGNGWFLGVNGYYLWYSKREAPLHAYWGAGPSLSWTHGHDQRIETTSQTGSGQPPFETAIDDERNTHGWRAGVSGALGVEWLVARRFGLFAEYGQSLSYEALESTSLTTNSRTGLPTQTQQSENTVHRWVFSGSGGSLGVSAYF